MKNRQHLHKARTKCELIQHTLRIFHAVRYFVINEMIWMQKLTVPKYFVTFLTCKTETKKGSQFISAQITPHK